MVFIVGTPNSDFLNGTADNDTILGLAGNDTVLGEDGNDLLFGFENNDILYGNRGNDTLRGGQDNDQLYGGQDNDQLYGDKGNDTVSGDQGSDTIYGLDDNDLLFGGQQDDVIFGNKGNDTIRGGKDNDLLRGGRDNDQLHGDLGNDSLYGDLDNDFLFGSDGNDFISANQGNDTINGNMGNDTAYGGQGNDIVRGGMQNDSLFGDKGNDTLYGDLGDDTIYGGADSDLIFGDQGEESKFGGSGNDVLFGNEGNDTIFGLGGNDVMYGNQGDDILVGNMAKDTLYGGQDDDTLRGGMESDRLFGDKGSDVLYGDLGADTLTGDVAGDTISDTFVIGRVSGIPNAATKTTGGPKREDADVITDFQACIDFISLTGGLTYDNLNIFQGTGADAANTIIQDKGTGEFLVVLQGFNREKIDGTSFIPAGPPDVRILATDGFATEASIGSPIDTGEFTISLPCPTEKPLPINYTISGTATKDTDYNPLSGVVIIPAGSNTVTIPIIPLGDTLAGEGNETVTLTLVDLPGYNPQTPLTATVNIADGPIVQPGALPIVFVTAPDPTAFEQGSKAGTFQFSRTGGDTSKDLTINYTVSGTASSDDFNAGALTGSVTIAAGKTVSDLIQIVPTNVGGSEPTETVTVSIGRNSDYIVAAPDTATVSIIDEQPLNLSAAPEPILVFDQNGTFRFGRTNINTAVTDAQNNDIIFLRAGTYNNNAGDSTITINKPLTFRGPNAGTNPTNGVTTNPAIVTVGTANQPVFQVVSGNNVTFEGLRIRTNGQNAIRYQVTADNSQPNNNIVIRQNEFDGAGPADSGIIYLDFLGQANSSARISENLIRDVTTTTDVTSGIQAFRISGNTVISDNLIANLTGPGIAADALTGAVNSNLIANNRVSNVGEQGIQLAGGNANITNNKVTNANTTSGADRGGIRLRNSGLNPAINLGTANITGNVITNSFNGISIRDGDNITGTVNVNRNNLIGNSNAAFYHGGTGTIDATNNWWDSPTGPFGTSGPSAIAGTGAGSVNFDPFAIVPF
jgi:Ca2+-binding RTX toxin-like protein